MCTQRPLWTFLNCLSSLLKFYEDASRKSEQEMDLVMCRGWGEKLLFSFVRGVQGLSWGGSELGMHLQ